MFYGIVLLFGALLLGLWGCVGVYDLVMAVKAELHLATSGAIDVIGAAFLPLITMLVKFALAYAAYVYGKDAIAEERNAGQNSGPSFKDIAK